jgi:pyruvate formate lyase activating enzyme
MAGKTMSASDVMKIVAQDHDYYEHSGGGLTISGGEPLEQVDFACDLLKMARQNGIHTAIDTAGNVPFDRFEKILPYANLILFDIKSLDSKQHQFYTGSANNRITDNIQRLLQIEFPIMIRVPVIPGVNDNDSFNSQLQTLIKDKKSILKVEYLPYHDLGKVKAASLN